MQDKHGRGIPGNKRAVAEDGQENQEWKVTTSDAKRKAGLTPGQIWLTKDLKWHRRHGVSAHCLRLIVRTVVGSIISLLFRFVEP
ncbi:hypothetical protein RvY_13753 [Ramazzottius varieornatus]|uniref:Uncharacterized protein n=1 Tax=Ramazzottius varieornatus TaxID=947166 RepID=A0A1D1VNZ4_RAMVA|nr:hypothetical protein RvY_13753 [Ramazzottius varieornatus]